MKCVICKQADQLTPDEQLQLVTYLEDKVRAAYLTAKPRRKWAEIRGAAPYPLLGEDAQAWVSRTRREADEQREQQLRRRS